jgi:hypothetical protein
MKRSTLYPMLVALVLCAAPPLISAAKVGAAAPDFTGTASNGKTFRLSDYRGKYVVLEWHNNECPFVRKQYNSGNMQRLQKQWTSQGVVWFTILSSAPGKQGYATASEENDHMAKMQAAPTAALLDPTGEIGHLFSSTRLRRSSTRFCTRRVASLSGDKRRSLSPCSNNKSSSRSASRGSSLAPDGYSASRKLADIVEGTGNRCKGSYLPSMNTRAPRDCSTATAIGRLANR